MPALAVTTYTAQQVSQHNTAINCWTIVNNKVYNLTSYISQHPGGQSAILGLCGIDASTTFNAKHGSSSAANAALATLYVGDLGIVTVDITAPSMPSNLSASLNSSNKVVLNWTASTDNIGVTGYTVLRNGSILVNLVNNNYIDNSVVANSNYSYTVRAFDAAANTSTISSAVSITTPLNPNPSDITAPSVPTNLMASVVSANQINLSWATSTDNVAVTGYNIYRNGTLISTSSTTFFNNYNLNPATSYIYSVSAFDAVGNVSALSSSVSATTLTTTPVPNPNPGHHNGDKNDNKDHEYKNDHGKKLGHSEHSNNRNNEHNNNENNNNNDDYGRARSNQVSQSSNHNND